MRYNAEVELLKAKAKLTLLLVLTTNGYILYEFDGKYPSLTNENYDKDSNPLTLAIELRANYGEYNIIFPCEEPIKKEDAGKYATRIYSQMTKLYQDRIYHSKDTTLVPDILDEMAEAKASTPDNQDKQTEAKVYYLNPPSFTKELKSSSIMKNVKKNARKVATKTEGVTRVAALKVTQGICGPTHFVLQSAADLVAAAEGQATKFILDSEDDYKVFMRNRQAKTERAQQYALDKASVIPNSVMGILKKKVVEDANPKVSVA